MSFLKLFLLGVMMVFTLNLGGCCGGGGETKVITAPAAPTTTLGQELQDLEEAYKKGAITKEEYENAKKKLMEQRTEENK
jgi:hypothetical protein